MTISSQTSALMLVIAISMVAGLTGCAHVTYYAPSGPGISVVGYGGAPRIRQIKIGSDLKILMLVEDHSSPARLSMFMHLRKGMLRLASPDMRFACQNAESVVVNIEKVMAGMAGAPLADLPWQAELVGEGSMLAGGGVSNGDYWIETLLPACAQGYFSVEIPTFSGTITGFPTEPVVFRLKEGRFIPFTQWM